MKHKEIDKTFLTKHFSYFFTSKLLKNELVRKFKIQVFQNFFICVSIPPKVTLYDTFFLNFIKKKEEISTYFKLDVRKKRETIIIIKSFTFVQIKIYYLV